MIPRLTGSLAQWADTASPGDRVIVQTARSNANREAEVLRDAGLITTAQKRALDGLFHLIAIKLRHKPRQDRAPLPCGQVRSDHAKAAREQLTKDRIALTAQRLMAGYKQIDIAEEFGVHPRTVGKYADKARRMGLVE
jgi:DNA-directed RNA polymerase specialized sigma24 family protein